MSKKTTTTRMKPQWSQIGYLSRATIAAVSSSIKSPLKSLGLGNSARSASILSRWNVNVAGNARNTTRPDVCASGNFAVSRKSVSLERMMRDSLSALSYTSSSGAPIREITASCPSASKTLTSLLLKFSSHKNFTVRRGNEAGNALSLRAARGELQSRADVLPGDGRPVLENVVEALSVRERFEHLPDHDAGSGECQLASAYFRVGDDIFVDGDALIHNIHSITPGNVKKQYAKKRKCNLRSQLVDDMVTHKPMHYLIKSDWKLHDVVKKIEEILETQDAL